MSSVMTGAQKDHLDMDKIGEAKTIFEDRRESVRSQVKKLAYTRKEIKKLIKIQNQHSKLLRQLQKNGIITVHPDESSRALLNTNGSLSEMSEH